jgi:hypothetical protein
LSFIVLFVECIFKKMNTKWCYIYIFLIDSLLTVTSQWDRMYL